ncbi:hypothetical protein AB0D83_18765 [Streptomyces decoyicus]|uniref:hypothetical protein n=1 Tax=Streptomyces decoyicus TaxID=249567 RepID=UPI003411B0AF
MTRRHGLVSGSIVTSFAYADAPEWHTQRARAGCRCAHGWAGPADRVLLAVWLETTASIQDRAEELEDVGAQY